MNTLHTAGLHRYPLVCAHLAKVNERDVCSSVDEIKSYSNTVKVCG